MPVTIVEFSDLHINGRLVSGAQLLERFVAIIEEELARAL